MAVPPTLPLPGFLVGLAVPNVNDTGFAVELTGVVWNCCSVRAADAGALSEASAIRNAIVTVWRAGAPFIVVGRLAAG